MLAAITAVNLPAAANREDGFTAHTNSMDTLGWVSLVVALLAFGAGITGFFVLARRGPKGAVLIVAAALYFVPSMLGLADTRLWHGLVGLMRMLGFCGGVLGLVDLVRRSYKEEPGE